MTAQATQATGLIIAAGSSARMGGNDKIFTHIFERPIISYSIQAMEDCADIGSIVLVLSRENLEKGRLLVECEGWSKVTSIVAGGRRRQDSVRLGLSEAYKSHWTVIHDGARPCITPRILENSLIHASINGSAVAAVPVKDTIKIVNESLIVSKTLDRKHLWAVQTPQVFATKALRHAHEKITEDVTDDASMMEALGEKVSLFQSEYSNIKVTTEEDIHLIELLMNN